MSRFWSSDTPDSNPLSVYSYADYEDEEGSPHIVEKPYPSFTAEDPSDGHCYFDRWEIMYPKHEGMESFVLLSTERTVTDSDIVGKISECTGGETTAEDLWWELRDRYGTDFEPPVIRAVFKIKRRVSVKSDAGARVCKIKRVDIDDGTVLDSVDANVNGSTEDVYLMPGETATISLSPSSKLENDPPTGFVHKRYEISMTIPVDTSKSFNFNSTKKYDRLNINTPSSTDDIVVGRGNEDTDRRNGWTISEAIIYYAPLTKMPIRNGAEMLCNEQGKLIADDGPCPIDARQAQN